MYLAAHHRVIPMDKVVYQPFKNGTVGIVGQIEAVVGHLNPSAHGVVLDEVHAVFQQQDKVCSVFYRADGIVLIESCPSGTEYARLEYGAVINEQKSGIGKFSVRSYQAK